MRGYKKIWTAAAAAMLLCLLWAKVSFAEEKDGQDEPSLNALSAVLMDARTGRVLWEKEGGVVRPMASTTKIMTCILALELGLGEGGTTQVSVNASSQPQVRLGMRAGQKFYTRDLLYSLMLESHNDSAVAVAEAAAGSVTEFARKMNQKAREIGCQDTWFITPNGLDGQETDEKGRERVHSTTARDLARILSYCILKSPCSKDFLKITQASDYSFQDVGKKAAYSCHNHNNLFHMTEGVLSGKTGFTGGAGYCYTGAVESEGRIFAIALLGCGWPPHKTYKWADAKALIAYGKKHYQYRDICRDLTFPPIKVSDGISAGSAWFSEDCAVQAAVEKKGAGLNVLVSDKDQVKILRKVPEQLKAPVRQGDRAGVVEYYLNDEKIASYEVTVLDSVEAFSFRWCARKVKDLFFHFGTLDISPEIIENGIT